MADLDTFDPSCPLRGAVLCCTSIPPEKRTELAERAEEMGAKHVYDLTSDATHLIVGEYDTPKYRYVAKERPDVKVVKPGWVDAVRDLWVADQKIDLESLEKQHTLPTFASLKISITGFEDADERQRISELILANGAEYHANMTKSVTHLLASRTEGPKYKAASQWDLRIVAIEWLHDSIERGMILDEKLYHPGLPIEERGKDAWRRYKPPTRVRKRTRTEEMSNEGRHKLRRTASAKFSNASEKMWGDIMVSGASAVTKEDEAGPWNESEAQAPVVEPIMEPAAEAQEGPVISKSIFKNHIKPRGLFAGHRFHLYGCNELREQKIRKFLTERDAQLAPTLAELVEVPENVEKSYILLPHDLPVSERPIVPETLSSIPVVTEFWLERCYNSKSIQDPAAHVLSRPFPKFPIPRFSDVVISSTAFDGFDLLQVGKAVNLLGATYDEYLTPKHSLLVCSSDAKCMARDKYDHARLWKIPIVSAQWLWDSIQAGERLPVREYVYRAKTTWGDTSPDSSGTVSNRSTEDNPPPRGRTSEKNLGSRSKTRSLSRNSSHLADTVPLDDEADTTLENDSAVLQEDEPCTTLSEHVPTKLPSTESTEPMESLRNKSESPQKSNSSPQKTPTASVPPLSNHVPQEDINNAISSLLARPRSSDNPATSDSTDGKKTRQRRIFGRVTSNISVTSEKSTESSLESTATHENADPKKSKPKDERALKKSNSDSQGIQPTQKLEWEEDGSAEHKNKIVAKITGAEGQRKGLKERAVTLSDLNETPRERRSGVKGRATVRKQR